MRPHPICALLLAGVALAGCGTGTGSTTKVAAAACSWHAEPAASGTANDLTGVSFPDRTHGWAVGGIDSAVVDATRDGGAHWSTQRIPGTNGLSAVSFADERHGWAVGVHNTVWATSDGGAHWRAENAHITTGDNLYGVWFVDPRHGWIDGAKGNLRMTSDGGRTWTPESSGTTQDLGQIGFIDAQHGWVVAGGDGLLQTSDGGRTWHQTYTGSAAREEIVAAATFLDADHGWEVGSETDPGADHSITSQTTNGGASWQHRTVASPDDVRFNAVAFTDLEHGWVGTYQGDLLYTDDGGHHWAERSDPADGEQVYGMTFRDATHGWAVGASGTIMACTA